MYLPTKKRTTLALLTSCFLLLGCGDHGEAAKELEREMAAKENDSKATGSACRQAGRALEDCYNLNPTAQRAGVFAGWREMNDYMRENKMTEVKPTIDVPKAEAAAGADSPKEQGEAEH